MTDMDHVGRRREDGSETGVQLPSITNDLNTRVKVWCSGCGHDLDNSLVKVWYSDVFGNQIVTAHKHVFGVSLLVESS